jgi:hypothetical protein
VWGAKGFPALMKKAEKKWAADKHRSTPIENNELVCFNGRLTAQ